MEPRISNTRDHGKANGNEGLPCAPLLDIVRNRIVPWAREGMERTIVATPQLHPRQELPVNVTATSHKLKGKRVTVRGKSRLEVSALWPDDGLLTQKQPRLACIIGGRSDFCLGEYTLHCPQGTFILIPAGTPLPNGFSHLDEGRDNSHWCDILWLGVWDKFLRCWVCHSRGSEHWNDIPGEAVFVGKDGVTEYFRALVSESTESGRYHGTICDSLLLIIFTLLQRLMEEGRYLHTYGWAEMEGRAVNTQSFSFDSREYIRQNLSKPLTLAKVGMAVGVSRTRLAGDFSGKNGPTFTQFLTSCRIEQAEKLLKTTDWSVGIIGEMVGLRPTRLREVFHEVHGCSPTEFRQRTIEITKLRKRTKGAKEKR